jgi:site-specific DNA-cytosine methylase
MTVLDLFSGAGGLLGEENICENINVAIDRANQIIQK